jgi:hypothetical protein
MTFFENYFLEIFAVIFIISLTAFILEKILTIISHSHYSIPNKIHDQHFWIEIFNFDDSTYYELHYRKFLGKKYINVKYKNSFQSLNDAELKAIELSEYHCSHLNLDHSSIVHHNDRIASIVFVTK